MDGNPESTNTPVPKDYKSRPGALIWFFRKSRDGWKRKYQDLKAAEKGYKNHIADLTKSREHWRTEAQRAGERRVAAEAELAAFRARVAAAAGEKKRTTPAR